MKNGKENFVHTLISTNEKNEYFKNLRNLPNLKLTELADYQRITFDASRIEFNGDSNVVGGGASLSAPAQRDNILRLILSDFLYVICNHTFRCYR